ncbi:helix-turn-helix domain-containing protein [Deinococcus budaensis]|uniref:Excisionase family DNA binding protein n=1 Tax=Deinococcus budaensis TaxID=1665626 RepID=A0A7W8GFB9_9DEIO|nr:helix-turn-helix domain-containing protein [Deinococcus budaensis]MBB5234433.1 excisionase family DNA binding protein [Deinococcus budaensis]
MKLAYTYDEAAAQLGCQKDLVRDLVASGDLQAFTVSPKPDARSKRISHAELTRFIAAREDAERRKFAGLTLSSNARQSA